MRYEIARAVIDSPGLLTVYINGAEPSPDPATRPARRKSAGLTCGRQKVAARPPHPAKHHLFKHREPMGEMPVGLEPLQDYTDPVEMPNWLADCQPGY